MVFALLSGECKQLVKASFQTQERFLWDFCSSVCHDPLSIPVHLCKQRDHLAAPFMAGIFTVRDQIANEMDIALCMIGTKMVQRCFMVMNENAGESRQKRDFPK